MNKPTANILTGDCRATMAALPEQHFHCCVTSPPYFGLRSYYGEAARINPSLSASKALEIEQELARCGVLPIDPTTELKP